MEIRSAFGLVVDFKARWCQYLVRGDTTVVEVAFPDDPFLFDDLTHPGMIFTSDILHTPGAAIRLRVSRRDVYIIAECGSELDMHKINYKVLRTIEDHARLFSSIEQ